MQREIKFRAWDKVDKVMKYFSCGIFNRLPAGAEDLTEPMQYTGLKDKNGEEIYEGDIVTGLFNHTDIIGHIVYGSDATFFIERKGLYGIGLNNAEDWLEVVGNIYENPELLNE